MTERIHVPFSERKEDMEKIKAITAELRKIVESMNCPPTIRAAYMNSVLNLEKKNENYGEEKVREKLTDEEKEVMRKALKEFREGKSTSITAETDSVPADESMKKKKGKHA